MLTLAQARYLARKVIGEFGFDFVYNTQNRTCQYVPLHVARAEWPRETWEPYMNGTPVPEDPREITGCLVGRILDEAGETRHHDARFCGKAIGQVYDDLPDIATDEAVRYLDSMQAPQDRGRSWGWSWAQAEIYAALHGLR